MPGPSGAQALMLDAKTYLFELACKGNTWCCVEQGVVASCSYTGTAHLHLGGPPGVRTPYENTAGAVRAVRRQVR